MNESCFDWLILMKFERRNMFMFQYSLRCVSCFVHNDCLLFDTGCCKIALYALDFPQVLTFPSQNSLSTPHLSTNGWQIRNLFCPKSLPQKRSSTRFSKGQYLLEGHQYSARCKPPKTKTSEMTFLEVKK